MLFSSFSFLLSQNTFALECSRGEELIGAGNIPKRASADLNQLILLIEQVVITTFNAMAAVDSRACTEKNLEIILSKNF